MKEQSVRVKQFLLELKNAAQHECTPKYWASMWLKIKSKEINCIVGKKAQNKPEQAKIWCEEMKLWMMKLVTIVKHENV